MSKQKKVDKIWISHPCTELLAASVLSALVMTNNINLSHFAWHLRLCSLYSLFLLEQRTVCNHHFSFSPASCPKTMLKSKIKCFFFFFAWEQAPHQSKGPPIPKTLCFRRQQISLLSQNGLFCEPWQVPAQGFLVSQELFFLFFKTDFSYVFFSHLTVQILLHRICFPKGFQTREGQKSRTE